ETATLTHDQLGITPGRVGNLLPASAPRNAYRTADERWVALSSASPNIAMRLFRAIDHPELADDPELADPLVRQARAYQLELLVAEWISARTLAEAMAVFESAEVAAAPVYDAAQLLADDHVRARGTFLRVDDPDLGGITVQSPVVRLSETPGQVRWLGRD